MVFPIQKEVVEDAQFSFGMQVDTHQTFNTPEPCGKTLCRLNNVLLQQHDCTLYHDCSHMYTFEVSDLQHKYSYNLLLDKCRAISQMTYLFPATRHTCASFFKALTPVFCMYLLSFLLIFKLKIWGFRGYATRGYMHMACRCHVDVTHTLFKYTSHSILRHKPQVQCFQALFNGSNFQSLILSSTFTPMRESRKPQPPLFPP